jgi:hypothetical protein
MKAVAGLYNPSLGAQGNETSGKMVIARQTQGDNSNFHFYDNLTTSIKFTGIIILDLIPYYYDTQRVIRIIGVDGNPKSVTVNDKSKLDSIGKVLNDITSGYYDVVMDTGPGYATKRQEEADALIKLMNTQIGEQIAHTSADIIVGLLDIPGIDAVVDRLKASNPLAQIDAAMPEHVDDETKAFITQMAGQLKQLQAQNQELMQEKQAKMVGIQAQGQSKLASDQLWANSEMEREKYRQDQENKRLLAKEHAANERATLATHVKIQDTVMKLAEEKYEADLDASVDLKLNKDVGQPNGWG